MEKLGLWIKAIQWVIYWRPKKMIKKDLEILDILKKKIYIISETKEQAEIIGMKENDD